MTSLEIIRLAVMQFIRFPPSLRNVEDMLHERGIDIFVSGAVLVEQIRNDDRRRDPTQAGQQDARPQALALAP